MGHMNFETPYTFEATLWCDSGWVDKDNLQLFLGTVCVREFKLIFLFASMRADLLTEPIANSVVHFTSDAWTSSSLVLVHDQSTRPDGVKVSLAPRFLLSQGGSATGAPTHSFGFSVLVVSNHEVEKLRGKLASIHAVSSRSKKEDQLKSFIEMKQRWWARLLSLIHIWRCRRIERCRSRWSPYH